MSRDEAIAWFNQGRPEAVAAKFDWFRGADRNVLATEASDKDRVSVARVALLPKCALFLATIGPSRMLPELRPFANQISSRPGPRRPETENDS